MHLNVARRPTQQESAIDCQRGARFIVRCEFFSSCFASWWCSQIKLLAIRLQRPWPTDFIGTHRGVLCLKVMEGTLRHKTKTSRRVLRSRRWTALYMLQATRQLDIVVLPRGPASSDRGWQRRLAEDTKLTEIDAVWYPKLASYADDNSNALRTDDNW